MTPQANGQALQVEGLWKTFGELQVLRGIDLAHGRARDRGGHWRVGLRQVHAAALPEPAGADRRRPHRVAGEEITAPGVDVDQLRRRIGIVFQAYNLFPHMTVLDNVTLAPRKAMRTPPAEADEAATRLLERFGLADKRLEYPDRLSGGQQQRVAIVRALAMQPSLLLLDEITSALDPELVAEVLNVVRELAASGMTMVIATHEMGFARDIANRVVFLDEGQILEEGPPEQIFTAPREPRTRAFLQRIIEAGRL